MAAPKRILLIDNEEGMCRMVEAVLLDNGYEVGAFTRSFEAVEQFDRARWDLVITDVKMPGMDGLEVLQRVKQKSAATPVIMITAYATVDVSIQALRKGAYDMLTKPFEPEELLYRVKNALKHTQLLEENQELKDRLAGSYGFENIVGSSPALRAVLDKVTKVAPRDLSVLITGESGTGKELVAQAIHYNSPRRGKRFVAINGGALPESILEGELFGYRKGAFTGAREDKRGLLEAADGGTLFLDEVGNLPLNVQKTLLRFLQEQEFLRLGDTAPTRVDVRVLSATNADLKAAVKAGTFRDDLYYRLNVVNLHLPPLREREADIPLLIAHFLKAQNAKFGTAIRGLDAPAMQAACAYPWPGNVRELRNVMEAAAALEGGETISLPVLAQFIEVAAPVLSPDDAEGEGSPYASAMARFEAEYLTGLLRRHGGNVEAAAVEAGVNMATLYRKIKKYGLRRDDRS